jgi:flagellar basal body-associated protein FliL
MNLKYRLKSGLLIFIGAIVVLGGFWSTYKILEWNYGSINEKIVSKYHDYKNKQEEKKKAEQAKKEEEERKLANVPEFTEVYELSNITLHLSNRKKNRTAYAQLTLLFDCANKEVLQSLEMYRAKILDVLYETANTFVIEDFKDAEGFDRFKITLMGKLHEKLPKAPRQIVLKDWLIN